MTIETLLKDSHLGQSTTYKSEYDPSLLFPIPRTPKRTEINVPKDLPFHGYDIWNAYELSWLNSKGKPQAAIAEIIIPCDSENIIESKSMKLYFNSLNQTKFPDIETLRKTIQNDFAKELSSTPELNIIPLSEAQDMRTESLSGLCLDDLDITIDDYQMNPKLLTTESEEVSESLYTNLFKSNCPATNQPDWASIRIQYHGKRIQHENLLRYLISFREHNEFHEQCAERIFMDITKQCDPKSLTVEARFTRRGGLDINPIRSTDKTIKPYNRRQVRQ